MVKSDAGIVYFVGSAFEGQTFGDPLEGGIAIMTRFRWDSPVGAHVGHPAALVDDHPQV